MKRADKITAGCVAIVFFGAAIALGWPLLGPDNAAQWKEILKGAVGPFLGAGLAFTSAMTVQGLKKRRENLCAGNLALLTISAQYNEFLTFRRRLRVDIASRSQELPDFPIWLLAPVHVSTFSSRTLDVDSLDFLFDEWAGVEVYDGLLQAQQHYEALRSASDQMSGCVQEIRTLMEPVIAGTPNLAAIESVVGIGRQMRAAFLLRLVLAETAVENVYLQAFNQLRAVLADRFSDASIPRLLEPRAGYRESDLAPLPPSLRQ